MVLTMSLHYRKTFQTYTERSKQKGCPFCDKNRMAEPVYEDDLIIVLHNLTKYDVWEMHDVKEHLLVIPKRHVLSFKDMTDTEVLAIMRHIGPYEDEGYNVYTRGVGFVQRSVEHHHTHLIKTNESNPHFSLYMRKPYFLIKK